MAQNLPTGVVCSAGVVEACCCLVSLIQLPVTAIGTLKVALKSRSVDLFGSQIQGDLIGASQWRIYQGVAKEFGSATSDSFP